MPRPTYRPGMHPFTPPIPPARREAGPPKQGEKRENTRLQEAIARAAEILTRYQYDPELDLYVDYEAGIGAPKDVMEALKTLLEACQEAKR